MASPRHINSHKTTEPMRSRKSPTSNNDTNTLASLISTTNDDSIIELINTLKHKMSSKDNITNSSIDSYQYDEIKQIDSIVTTIKNLLDNTKTKERKLSTLYDNVYDSYDIRMIHIEKGGNSSEVGIDDDDDDSNLLIHKFDNTINESTDSYQCPLEHHTVTFRQALVDRAGWLIGLLALQSCSSFILAANEKLIQMHPTIIYFLTMLVGAGG